MSTSATIVRALAPSGAPTRWVKISSCALAVLGASALALGRDEPAGPAPARVEPRADTPAGVDAGWWQAARAEISRMEYELGAPTARPGGGGGPEYHAPNRAQNFRTVFEPRGPRVYPRSSHADEAPAWEWGLELLAWGRGDELAPAGGAQLAACGNRIEYQRDGLVEWYVNDAPGLEQGFTIACDPTPARPHGAFLDVRMAVTGTVHGGLQASGEAIDFLTPEGALAIRLSDLRVQDARGRSLPAWFELDAALGADAGAQALSIRVDDRDATYPITIDPLATSPAWIGEGNQNDAGYGWRVATAGDVNGDGYSDVVVGCPSFDYLASNSGAVFVYHGSSGGVSSSANRTIGGVQAWGALGDGVATAGDLNGDGFSDLVVGAPAFDHGETNEGYVWVYYGSASGVVVPAGWTAEINQAGASFGGSVASAGDVNGDGYSDLLVGAPNASNPQAGEGSAFLYLGSSTGVSSSPAWISEGNLASSAWGSSLATAGDVNGDGYGDVIIGAPGYSNPQAGEGRAVVYHGSAAALGGSSWTVEGNQAGAAFGGSVATAGDVNGDGYSDVIVGARSYSNGETSEGRAFVYYGSAGGLGVAPAWTDEGNEANANFGQSVSTAGDVNGDGYADVIVGAPGRDNDQADEGRAFVYYGSSLGLNLAWTSEGNQTGCAFGSSVAIAGDVNGDGFSDVIVGAPYYDSPQTDEGRAFVYLGSAAGLRASSSWYILGNQATAFYGTSVAAAGDVNGDGYGDVIVSASLYANPEDNEGRVFVYHGDSFGLSGTPNWTAEGNQIGAQFGCSASTAGDVNGDGYADVIIGALGYAAPQVDEGRAFVYYGSASGLSSTPNWTAECNVAGAFFGSSVSWAGDVNGDGFSDVIVGADNYNGGQTNEGAAFVYHGSAGGLAAAPNWGVQGDAIGASLGRSVAGAGDVDGDGFSDVIVGVPLYDNGQTNEGRALVYRGGPGGLSTAASWNFESNQANAWLGRSVASAGDVNGDGFSDVVVGAPLYDGAAADTGRAYLFLGSVAGPSPTPDWTIEATSQAGSEFGTSVASAGDVDGDGYSDVVLGAPFYDDGQVDEGAAWVYHGSATGPGAFARWAAVSDQDDGRLGECVSSAGDVDGDGYADVIVGSLGYDTPLPGGINAGAAFLYMGNEGRAKTAWPRQKRLDGSIIAPLGRSDSTTTFQISAYLYPIFGRTMAAMEYEVEPRTVRFDGLNTQVTPEVTALGLLYLNLAVSPLLTPGTPYHWRLRARFNPAKTPFQQHGPWIHMPTNGWNETDLRTAGIAPPWAFCFGDGTNGACPCANNGSAGHGCANSTFAAGALLAGSGVASVAADTVVLNASSMTGASCVFFQGTEQQVPVIVDDGLGCVTGTVIRLGTKSVASNASSYPQAGDPRISVRGAIPAVGGTRYYQCFYRNAAAAFCPPATSNRTNGVAIQWAP